jgi:catechol 2,3-dioxygenase-like lactoylglutathione lyase family enzyme
MDVSARFNVESTRYAVYRQGEWAFYVIVEAIEAEGIKLGVYFMHRDASALSPRWTSLARGNGVRVPVGRPDGTREHVVITVDEIQAGQAVLEFQMPDGARLDFVDERDPSGAG